MFTHTVEISDEEVVELLVKDSEHFINFLIALATEVRKNATFPECYSVAGKLRTIASDTKDRLQRERRSDFNSAIEEIMNGEAEERASITCV